MRSLSPRCHKLLASLACFIIFIAAAEAYLRGKGYQPALDSNAIRAEHAAVHAKLSEYFDPDLGWINVPSNDFPAGEPDFDSMHTTIWSDGQRESRPLVLRPARYKVLLLGCSYTFGLGLKQTQTYPWLLNMRCPGMSFDNFGCIGYGTVQSLLLEERILSKKRYDLVIYAPFRDHIYRNIFGLDGFQDFGRGLTLPDALKVCHPIWYTPTAYLDGRHEPVIVQPYYRHWPGDSFLAGINTLKRLDQFCAHLRLFKLRKAAPEQLAWKEIYWRLLRRMNETAVRHGSRFAVMCLEDAEDPAVFLRCLTPAELAQADRNSADMLSFPPPFEYLFVGNGREGQPDHPRFHVKDDPKLHPSELVNKVWARNICSAVRGMLY